MRPPRLSRTLLGWLTPGEDRDFVLNDLEELFRFRVEADGPSARRYQHDIVIFGTNTGIHQFCAIRQLHRDLAVRTDIHEVRQ